MWVAALLGITLTSAPAYPLQPQSSCAHGGDEISVPTAAVARLTVEGDLQVVDTGKIVASVQQQRYAGDLDAVKGEVKEGLRRAWQERGFFKVEVNTEANLLTSTSASERVSVLAHINAGQQYRLGEITFKNTGAITNLTALRNLFSLQKGEIFNGVAAAEGLENLRKAYAQAGYINVAVVPQTIVDDQHRTVSLVIDVDEGKQFHITSIDVDGSPVSPDSQNPMFSAGQIYNERLFRLFLQKHGVPAPPSLEAYRVLDQAAGMVAIHIDTRECSH
jgi:hypothetical protein